MQASTNLSAMARVGSPKGQTSPKKDEIPFELRGTPLEKQTHKWVLSQAKQKNGKALIKHLMALHKPDSAPCPCGHTDQAICDMFEWDHPNKNAFYYASAYRHYPRVMKLLPNVNHRKYVEMIIGYKSIPEVLTFFATTDAGYPAEELNQRLNEKSPTGNWWSDPKMIAWFKHSHKSSKSGMLNRWRKSKVLKKLIDELLEAEVIVDVMMS